MEEHAFFFLMGGRRSAHGIFLKRSFVWEMLGGVHQPWVNGLFAPSCFIQGDCRHIKKKKKERSVSLNSLVNLKEIKSDYEDSVGLVCFENIH